MNALESLIMKSNKVKAIKCMRSQEVNLQSIITAHLQKRNQHLLEVCELSKEESNIIGMRMRMVAKEKNISGQNEQINRAVRKVRFFE